MPNNEKSKNTKKNDNKRDNKKDNKKDKKSERIRRKSSERKSSVKKTWERFVQQSDSRNLLKDIWKSENSIKEYSDKINKLHKKYCN
jgi:hypothetical protein